MGIELDTHGAASYWLRATPIRDGVHEKAQDRPEVLAA
jgi:hypothetical protein